MLFFQSLAGQVRLALTCADPAKALSDIRSLGVLLSDVEYIDDLCLHVTVSRNASDRIADTAQRKGWDVRLLKRKGLFWKLMGLVHRPVLVLGLSFLLLLSLLLPGRVLFVQVEGNCAVPTNQILEAAAKHGVCMGASGRELRSERIKNALLDDIPQLQWLGVNVRGCVAVISVRERQKPEQDTSLYPVTSICAKVDGIIQSVTVTQGTALCKPGDGVTAGQTLISGYADLGICQQLTQAKGEVFALTARKITAVTPKEFVGRGEKRGQTEKYGLLIGKKRINFYKGSGILDITCARIYLEWYMTLPGGFVLPIGIVKEVWMDYAMGDNAAARLDLADAAQSYLLNQLTDGQILASQSEIQENDTIIMLHGRYACREMIGVTRIEENLSDYGKDPGADRQR